jgi:hypothetical protein
MIRSGQENYLKSKSMIDLKVALDYSSKNEVCSTDKNGIININMQYAYKDNVEDLSAELLREYCHVLGFKNSPLKARLRVYTVPYRIERIVANQLHKQATDKLAKNIIVQHINLENEEHKSHK